MSLDDRYYISDVPPETPEPQGQPEPWTTTTVVGKRLPRIDGYERVSGAAIYTSDVILPGMLYAATLRSPHAHAIVKKLDASTAERMPGVAAVLTPTSPGADIPWYNTRSGPLSRLLDTTCRYEGDEIAVVAAETPYQAWDAVKAIVVEYEKLPFVSDEQDALKADAPAVHKGGTGSPSPRGTPGVTSRPGSRRPTSSWSRPTAPGARSTRRPRRTSRSPSGTARD